MFEDDEEALLFNRLSVCDVGDAAIDRQGMVGSQAFLAMQIRFIV